MTKSRPVIITMSILGGLQLFFGTAGLADVLPAAVVFIAIALVAAAQFGLQFYVQNAVVPSEDVLAYKDAKGIVVAGDATLDVITGAPAEVSVEPAYAGEHRAGDA